jgi:V8-like Glu-specific endopeptidase
LQPSVSEPVHPYKVTVPEIEKKVITPRALLPRKLIPEGVAVEKVIATVDAFRDGAGQAIDSRTAVRREDLTGLPFSAIGQLVVDFPSGRAIGTGFLVGPGVVLTAAHVLFHPTLGRAVRAEFTPGCRAADVPQKAGAVRSQSVLPNRLRVSDAWAHGDTALAGDYGALLLSDAVAFADCGVLAVKPVGETFVERHARRGSPGFIVAGFPEEKALGTQWYGNGAILRSPVTAILHLIDTTPGESGAPLLALVANKGGEGKSVLALGIHSRPAEFALNYNQARRIDGEVLDDLKRWSDENPPTRR